MTIRIGFYGAGFISRYHQLLLSQCPVEHAIVAVHDVDDERAAAFAEQTGACDHRRGRAARPRSTPST